MTRDRAPPAHTAQGDVRARFVVRATEAYTADLAGLRRALSRCNSVDDRHRAARPPPSGRRSHWDDAETLLDGRHRYVYPQRTADDRIAIGGRGAPYRFGSRTDREGPPPAATVARAAQRLLTLFPPPARRRDRPPPGTASSASPRDWTPAVGAGPGDRAGPGRRLRRRGRRGRQPRRPHAARSHAGRATRSSPGCPGSRPLVAPWEPEPLRFAGVRAVNGLWRPPIEREARTGRAALAARARQPHRRALNI